MADPRLKTVRDAIVTRLEGIDGSGTFNNTIGEVAPYLKGSADVVGRAPGAFVWLDRFDRSPARLSQSGSGAMRTVARFTVRMTLKEATSADPSAILALIQDAANAIESDPKVLALQEYVEHVYCEAGDEITAKKSTAGIYAAADLTVVVQFLSARGSL